MPREPRPVPVYKQRRIAAEQAKRAELAAHPNRLAVIALDVQRDGIAISARSADGRLLASYVKLPVRRVLEVEIAKLVSEIHELWPKAAACAAPVR